MTVLFWVSAAIIFYTYFGYGLLIILLASLRPRRRALPSVQPLSATLLIAAHNEAPNIPRKLENALSLDLGPHSLEVLVVSDGSRDDTVLEARKFADRGVRTIEITEHVGKANAMNHVLPEISTDVVVFSDANSQISEHALQKMLGHFSDPEVGGVCGSIGVSGRKRSFLGQGEALYWRYDHALKVSESELGGAVSAQGSLYAIERDLLSPLPNAVADDLLNSLRVVAQGKRLVFEPQATVKESVSDSTKAEFGRRVRSTERGWRGLMLMSELLNPLKFKFYSIQLFSHKVLRRIAPLLLVLLGIINAIIIDEGMIYAFSAWGQVVFYGLAAFGWITGGYFRILTAVPFFFVLGHAAMALGLINFARGKRSDRWSPARGGRPGALSD